MLTEWTERFTFDVIGRVAFGYDFKAVNTGSHPYLTQIQASGELSDARRHLPFLQAVSRLLQTLLPKPLSSIFIHQILLLTFRFAGPHLFFSHTYRRWDIRPF